MKQIVWTVGVVLIAAALAIGGYVVGQSRPSAQALQAETQSTTQQLELTGAALAQGTGNEISVDGRVVPVQQSTLSFPIAGIVAEILVAEGEQVESGTLLLRLDAAQQRVAIAQAQANLKRVQARLDELKAGPRPQEIAAAQAALNANQARLDRIRLTANAGDIAAAQASVTAAQASLAKVNEGPNESERIALENDLANSEAELRRTQRAYDQVKWRNDIGATQESAALERATNNYNAAQARLNALNGRVTQADINAASAQVSRSQAQLNSLNAGLPADIAVAQANLQASQAQLELVQAGVRNETLEAAAADVEAATAALQQTLVTLANSELRAPFAGTIARLQSNLGEQIAPGSPVVQLADLTRWQIETENLKELDIANLAPNASVQLSFDAIPNLQMLGTVRLIRPIGEDDRGDIVYTAVIDPAQNDPRLLWNMTAVVKIEEK